jgi:hypothetical protein
MMLVRMRLSGVDEMDVDMVTMFALLR